MKKNIVNVSNLDWQIQERGDFSYYRKRLGYAANGEKLGVSLYKLMPGKKAFPYHYHYANEEAIFVLEGQGTLRMNNEEISLREGDYVALPTGKEFAHQVINTSNAVLVYFCLSTMNYPEVVEYPDSNKLGITAGVSKEKAAPELKEYFCREDAVDYFKREN